MALWSMVRRLHTARFSRYIVVETETGCASLNHFDLVYKGLGVGVPY